jgi:hypothetical protein
MCQSIWDKNLRCYGEHVEEHIGNLREHISNQGKMKKDPFPKDFVTIFGLG